MNVSRIKWHSVIPLLGVVLVPSAYAQTYFDELAARSDVVLAIPFRSAEDVSAYWAPNNHTDVDYDSVQDGLRFSWPSASASNVDSMDINIDPPISSGNVFITWEDKWSPEWAAAGDGGSINGINVFKNHHVKNVSAYNSGGLQLEIRKLHRKSRIAGTTTPAGSAGYVDIRTYFIPSDGRGPADSLLGIQNDFLLDIDVWARYFLFIEYGGNGKISLWVTQPGDAPTAIYLQAVGDSAGDPGVMRRFQFQHNSSQTYSGGAAYEWCRNLVVLDGVANLSAAEALVAQGTLGGPPPVRPNSPNWVPDP